MNCWNNSEVLLPQNLTKCGGDGVQQEQSMVHVEQSPEDVSSRNAVNCRRMMFEFAVIHENVYMKDGATMSRSLFRTIENYLTPFFLRAVYAACATSSRASAYICYGRSHFSLFLTLIQFIFIMSSSARIICKDTSRLWPKTLSIGSFSRWNP